jgi:SAM-dependent methyltransferase
VIYKFLPQFIFRQLFGDRKRFGLIIQQDDPCWKEWESVHMNFYYATQKRSIGAVVNNAGYKVMSRINMSGKKVLEIGPGDINHICNWRTDPDSYTIADISENMLEKSSLKLKERGVNYSSSFLVRNETGSLPFDDEEFDIVVSFYSLEHFYPLDSYLRNILKILKPGGKLIGAIPCEGGLAWATGRFFTSRRWLENNSKVDINKIICWEHPNFSDQIINTLDSMMKREYISYWPFGVPSIDINLIIRFIYEKS